jgi:MoaA/NifB/PqqE/SkfB family radical SAM enzyme
MESSARRWKMRLGPDGLHLFRRADGFNVLVDAESPAACWTTAPRQVSVALTNACDLRCAYCYAPKRPAALKPDRLLGWLRELDAAGSFGVGFGGGEPTLHPSFSEICRETAQSTGLAVTFTTHAHHVTRDLCRAIAGSVHFARISMDGVGATYERLRGRSYNRLLERIAMLASVTRIGLNIVVNADTVGDLSEVAEVARVLSASEVLLLPEQGVRGRSGIDDQSAQLLRNWVQRYTGPVRFVVSEAGAHELPVVNPLPNEHGLRVFAHIDAAGTLRSSSFSGSGVPIGTSVMASLRQLEHLEQFERRVS